MKKEVRCPDCDKYIQEDELLIAANPFDDRDTITGCPKCQSIGPFTNICDEDGCRKSSGCGWPSEEGYRHTCFEHWKR